MEGASSAISGQLDVMDGLTQQFEQLLAKPKDEEREGLGRQVTVIFDERCLLHINPFQHFEQAARIAGIFHRLRSSGLFRSKHVRVLPAIMPKLSWIQALHPAEHISKVLSACPALEEQLPPAEDLEKLGFTAAQTAHASSLLLSPESLDTFSKAAEIHNFKHRLLAMNEDNYTSEATPAVAALAAGGVVRAVQEVVAGRSPVAFAIMRPPGHHCHEHQAGGFCYFNNVAVAARYAQREHGVGKVAILDWDVHHGDGTQNIFESDPTVLLISMHRFGNFFFPNTPEGGAEFIGTGAGTGRNVNIPWPAAGLGDVDYAAALEYVVLPMLAEFQPEMILISSGFDAAAGDFLGGMELTPIAYRFMTACVASLDPPKGLVVALEGGYNIKSISHDSENVLRALIEAAQGSRRKGLGSSMQGGAAVGTALAAAGGDAALGSGAAELLPCLQPPNPLLHSSVLQTLQRVAELHAPYWSCMQRLLDSGVLKRTLRLDGPCDAAPAVHTSFAAGSAASGGSSADSALDLQGKQEQHQAPSKAFLTKTETLKSFQLDEIEAIYAGLPEAAGHVDLEELPQRTGQQLPLPTPPPGAAAVRAQLQQALAKKAAAAEKEKELKKKAGKRKSTGSSSGGSSSGQAGSPSPAASASVASSPQATSVAAATETAAAAADVSGMEVETTPAFTASSGSPFSPAAELRSPSGKDGDARAPASPDVLSPAPLPAEDPADWQLVSQEIVAREQQAGQLQSQPFVQGAAAAAAGGDGSTSSTGRLVTARISTVLPPITAASASTTMKRVTTRGMGRGGAGEGEDSPSKATGGAATASVTPASAPLALAQAYKEELPTVLTVSSSPSSMSTDKGQAEETPSPSSPPVEVRMQLRRKAPKKLGKGILSLERVSLYQPPPAPAARAAAVAPIAPVFPAVAAGSASSTAFSLGVGPQALMFPAASPATPTGAAAAPAPVSLASAAPLDVPASAAGSVELGRPLSEEMHLVLRDGAGRQLFRYVLQPPQQQQQQQQQQQGAQKAATAESGASKKAAASSPVSSLSSPQASPFDKSITAAVKVKLPAAASSSGSWHCLDAISAATPASRLASLETAISFLLLQEEDEERKHTLWLPRLASSAAAGASSAGASSPAPAFPSCRSASLQMSEASLLYYSGQADERPLLMEQATIPSSDSVSSSVEGATGSAATTDATAATTKAAGGSAAEGEPAGGSAEFAQDMHCLQLGKACRSLRIGPTALSSSLQPLKDWSAATYYSSSSSSASGTSAPQFVLQQRFLPESACIYGFKLQLPAHAAAGQTRKEFLACFSSISKEKGGPAATGGAAGGAGGGGGGKGTALVLEMSSPVKAKPALQIETSAASAAGGLAGGMMTGPKVDALVEKADKADTVLSPSSSSSSSGPASAPAMDEAAADTPAEDETGLAASAEQESSTSLESLRTFKLLPSHSCQFPPSLSAQSLICLYSPSIGAAAQKKMVAEVEAAAAAAARVTETGGPVSTADVATAPQQQEGSEERVVIRAFSSALNAAIRHAGTEAEDGSAVAPEVVSPQPAEGAAAASPAAGPASPVKGPASSTAASDMAWHRSLPHVRILIPASLPTWKLHKQGSDAAGGAAAAAPAATKAEAAAEQEARQQPQEGHSSSSPSSVLESVACIWRGPSLYREHFLLCALDPRIPREIASITKCMTAAVVLGLEDALTRQEAEREADVAARETGAAAGGAAAAKLNASASPAPVQSKLSRVITVSRRAAVCRGGTIADIHEGEKMSVLDLLHGLMLPSGNDAATALADYYGQYCRPVAEEDWQPYEKAPHYETVSWQRQDPISCFVAEMNRTAAALGMTSTVFANPHGLVHCRNRSTAEDVARMVAACMSDARFERIVGCKSYEATVTLPPAAAAAPAAAPAPAPAAGPSPALAAPGSASTAPVAAMDGTGVGPPSSSSAASPSADADVEALAADMGAKLQLQESAASAPASTSPGSPASPAAPAAPAASGSASPAAGPQSEASEATSATASAPADASSSAAPAPAAASAAPKRLASSRPAPLVRSSARLAGKTGGAAGAGAAAPAVKMRKAKWKNTNPLLGDKSCSGLNVVGVKTGITPGALGCLSTKALIAHAPAGTGSSGTAVTVDGSIAQTAKFTAQLEKHVTVAGGGGAAAGSPTSGPLAAAQAAAAAAAAATLVSSVGPVAPSRAAGAVGGPQDELLCICLASKNKLMRGVDSKLLLEWCSAVLGEAAMDARLHWSESEEVQGSSD